MLCLYPSKALGLVGEPCLTTGAKIGRAMLTLMAKPCLSRSPPATAALLSPTMWLLPPGNLARLSLADSSSSLHNLNFIPKLTKILLNTQAD